MKRILSLIVLFALSNMSFGQSVTMEEKVVAKAGRLASVNIKTDGKATSWIALPSENLDIFREYDPDPSVIKLKLLSYDTGTFYIVASTTLNDKIATKTCIVTIGEPVKPEPIVPVESQLLKNFKAVYAADSSVNKDQELEALIALYDQGSVFVKTRPDMKTYGQVWTAFDSIAKTLGCSGKLIAVQQLIQNEMQLNGIPMNPADGGASVDKDKLVPQLQRIANLLKRINEPFKTNLINP